jgi:hypothetical protein
MPTQILSPRILSGHLCKSFAQPSTYMLNGKFTLTFDIDEW